ncbi:MAG: glycosyltransferase family 2 protein [Acidobacteria bacterium]|nr:glycosyltransferase family 2 protein [Acidobacteriota bacterium]
MIRIVVPMGGEGRQFAERGYTFPKPLIEVAGQPLVELVVRNLTPEQPHRFVFICRAEHVHRYALADVLRLVAPGCEIVTMHQPTAGALCSVLLALEHLQHDDELIVANADQWIDLSIDRFLAAARDAEWDGALMTFPNTHPRWSYARVEGDAVVAVAEKQPISRHATTGLYYFRRGGEFVSAAERTLLKNAAVGGEFYVAPVFNELILAGKRVGHFPIAASAMHGLGTPEELERFQARAYVSPTFASC